MTASGSVLASRSPTKSKLNNSSYNTLFSDEKSIPIESDFLSSGGVSSFIVALESSADYISS